MVNIDGAKNTVSLTTETKKIFEVEEKVDIHIIDVEEFKNNILNGLDMIQKFHLDQDEKLQIIQKVTNLEIKEKKENVKMMIKICNMKE